MTPTVADAGLDIQNSHSEAGVIEYWRCDMCIVRELCVRQSYWALFYHSQDRVTLDRAKNYTDTMQLLHNMIGYLF